MDNISRVVERRIKLQYHRLKKCKMRTIIIISFANIIIPSTVFAQSSNWTGSQSSNWSDAGNWSGNVVPPNAASSQVTINNSTANPVQASGISFVGGSLNIASSAGSTGSLVVSNNSNFQLQGVNIGAAGVGNLTFLDSGLTSVGTVSVGSSANGQFLISGQNSSLQITGTGTHLNIGSAAGGYGHVQIANGASVTTRNVSLGNLRGSGDLIVTGAGSTLLIDTRDLSAAGSTGNVYIEVSDGGLIDIRGDTALPNSRGLLQLGSNSGTFTELVITGANSSIVTTGNGLIAEFGRVSARIEDVGKLEIGNHLIVGGGIGNLSVARDAVVAVEGDVVVGINQGRGSLTLSDGGVLRANGGLYLAAGVSSQGVLNIGAAINELENAPGVLDVANIIFGSSNGVILFNHMNDEVTGPYEFAQELHGLGTIEHYAGFTRFTALNASSFSGATTIHGGTLQVDGALGGDIIVEQGGRLQGIGTVGTTFHHGTIAPGNSIGTLTIDGDYSGYGGRLELEAVLGDDHSLTDKLVITGSTSGHTNIHIINLGGTGMPTVEGIRIVEVHGNSDGVFNLLSDYAHNGENVVVAGAYAYKLRQHDVSTSTDGNWYLRSVIREPITPDPGPVQPLYQAGASTYEIYSQALQELSALPTLRQRIGSRKVADSGFWVRSEGSYNRRLPEISTTQTIYDQNIFKIHMGVDSVLKEDSLGTLVGGIKFHYANSLATTHSVHGGGKISAHGYGIGSTLTWYGKNHFYVDAQAELTWYRSDLHSKLARSVLIHNNKSFGYALSIEAGKHIDFAPHWSLTPQAQFTYSNVGFDKFTDRFDAFISGKRDARVKGRLGLALNHENTWQDDDGASVRTNIYGIANLYYEFSGNQIVDVAGASLSNKGGRFQGGIGVGGSYNWDDDRFSVYGEGLVDTSLGNFGDSYSLKGTVGFRMQW